MDTRRGGICSHLGVMEFGELEGRLSSRGFPGIEALLTYTVYPLI